MPAAVADITAPLWRGAVVVRILTAAVAVAALATAGGDTRTTSAGWALLAAIAGWTAVSCAGYLHPATRRTGLLAADLLVTLALLAASAPLLSGPGAPAPDGPAPLTAMWAAGPVAAAAVHAGRFLPALFGAAAVAVDVGVRGGFTVDVARDAVLLAVTAAVFGLAAVTARRATERLRRAARAEMAVGERERVVRDLHEGLLRALPGMRAQGDAELNRMAEEQQTELRSLTGPAAPDSGDGDGDLAAALRALAGSRVEVSVPADGVALPAADVRELVALTEEAIDTAAAHGGPEAKTWVAVEDHGAEIVLTVRDDLPPDIPVPDAPAHPSRQTRDRVADLGAVLTLDADAARGTEWRIQLTRTRRELLR